MQYSSGVIGADVFDIHCSSLTRVNIYYDGPLTFHSNAFHHLPELQEVYVSSAMPHRCRNIRKSSQYEDVTLVSGAVHDCPHLQKV